MFDWFSGPSQPAASTSTGTIKNEVVQENGSEANSNEIKLMMGKIAKLEKLNAELVAENTVYKQMLGDKILK
jgi:hypothetical protein